jgi:glucose/arabinose dehydrogenase/fibronectin type 3 domain-containing protein
MAIEAYFVALVMVAGLLLVRSAPAAADDFTDPTFTTETVATFSPFSLVGMAFAPDGRMFVWQKNGVVRIVKNGAALPTPFLNFSSKVNTYDDRGMWGLAFDPNFAANGYVYLTYVFENTGNPNDSGEKTARLTRVTADPNNPDVALAGSETVILGSIGTPPCSAHPVGADCIAADAGAHTLGSIVFAPDGTMFLGNGDGSDGGNNDTLALRAQNLNSYNGKILRINKDGTAVAGNPFYDGTNSVRSKVWLYGVRNPFRFSIQPGTGDLWFGDVGWNTWEEINRGVPGANYGWPCYEGPVVQPAYSDDAPCTTLPASQVTHAFHSYNHSVGSTAIGGPFYTGTAYPQEYRNNFFFADYAGGFIKRVTFDANHNPVSVLPFATDVDTPVGLVLGPDGLIYYLAFNSGQIRRIRSNGPSAHATATPSHGYSPLQVNFSSVGSENPGGGSLSYLWDFGDGTSSTEANPSHTYTSPTVRTFTAMLTVTNSSNRSSAATVSVTVGSVPPVPTITSPGSGFSVQPGQTVNFTGLATDADDGAVAPANLKWTVLLHHNTHVHTFVGGTGLSGSFVAEDHGPIGTFSYEIMLTATDSSGLQGTTSVILPVGSDTTPPTAPTNLTANASASSIALGWSPATDDIALASYRVERCQGTGCSTFAQVATPTTTTYVDAGLLPATSYSYRVAALDVSGNVSAYSNVATASTSPATPAPVGLVAGYSFDAGSGTTVSDVSGSGNTGTITGAMWTNGKYGGALAFDGAGAVVRIPAAPSLNLGTAMTLAAWIQPTAAQSGWRTIMQRETEAYFLNASNGSGTNVPAGGATTGGDTTVVTGTSTAPVGVWTHVAMTYDGSSLRLYVNGTLVRTTGAGGAVQTTANPLWIGGNSPYGEHFAGLIDEARVYNRALSATEIQSAMATPLVPPVPDNTPPTAPSGLTATAAGAGQVNLAWTAGTDNVGVTGYTVERCAGAGCSTFGPAGTASGTTFSDSGLAPATSYTYRVRATDGSGNSSPYSNLASVTTTTAPDTTAPTAPQGLSATVAGTTQINLAWAASTDNVGVAQYRIERCAGANCTGWTQVGTSTTTTFASTGLTTGTTYRHRVRAADQAGNLSAYSNIVSATTQASDTTRPSRPTGLTATAAGPNLVNLAWTASTDNVGVTGYRVERCQGAGCTNYVQIATPPSNSHGDATVAPSSLYRYRVRANDAAGNLSTYSTVVNVTTPAAPDNSPPAPPGGPSAVASGLTINVGWLAATDNVGVTGYRVERCVGVGCATFTQVATPAAPGYADSGLAATTSYSYRVVAVDAAGNVSAYSTVVSATTGTAPVLPAGLVAGYSFNAASGTAAIDSSGHGNHGTLLGGATFVAGRYGNGVQFDGVDNVVRVASAPSLALSTGMTLAAWIKPTAAQSGWRTVMQRQVDAYFLNASNDSGTLIPAGGATVGGDTSVVRANAACEVNSWTHVALTYDGAALRLYVNGALVNSAATTGAIDASANPLWIGGNSPYGEYFTGVIDEAQVYSRALSAAELQTVMNTSLS